VVFEVLSPGNTFDEMIDKYVFYEEYGGEEYYIYEPDRNRLHAYLRRGEVLLRQRDLQRFVSPRLGIRFDLSGSEMVVYHPDGRRFLTFEELEALREEAQRQAEQAQQQAEQAQQRAARLAELSRKARRQQASPEELAELEHLEDEASAAGSSGTPTAPDHQ
jgi:Putative restriction endonuclease